VLAGLVPLERAAEPLVTGRFLAPPSSPPAVIGGMPLNLQLSPDGRYAVATTAGYRQGLYAIRTSDGTVGWHLDFDPSPTAPANGLYYGLCFGSDGTLFASQGMAHRIARLAPTGSGQWTPASAIDTGDRWPAGLALDHQGLLYVADLTNEGFFGHSGLSIYQAGQRVGSLVLPGPSHFSTAVAVRQDGHRAWLANLADGTVDAIDTTRPEAPQLLAAIATGSHPDALLMEAGEAHLWVANGQSDTLSVIDTTTDEVVDTIPVRPPQAGALGGATPTGLAWSPDRRTLYVSLADMNAVAVVDVADRHLRGYLPTGAWPTSLVAVPGRVLVCNGNGSQTRHPNPDFDPWHAGVSIANPGYVLNRLDGTVSVLDPSADLPSSTRLVLSQNHLLSSIRPTAITPRPHIDTVVYVVKENRTYDQVMGDVAAGNGDARLALFGARVTPNQHALAKRFVLLDNFYTNGDVSGSGWVWSTSGMANEYVIRNMPYVYRLPGSWSGLNYNFEGQVLGYLVGGFPPGLSDLFPAGLPPRSDLSEGPGGHLWDVAAQHGVSYRNYGFFYSFGEGLAGHVAIPDNYPAAAGLQPPGHNLDGHSDADYRRFDLDYPDSDGPQQVGAQYRLLRYGAADAPSRIAEWRREFALMMSRHQVPHLMLVRLGNDHTVGLKGGEPSPAALVADNDYAVGELIDTLSHSPIWPHTAVFIIEDDAQNGPDHVDCHRSPCLVISPWIKSGSVDHRFYNTDSVLRSVESLLRLPPMSQYDALAEPIDDWSAQPSNGAAYEAVLPAAEVLSERTPRAATLSLSDPRRSLIVQSDSLIFDRPDRAPADVLNEILWKSMRPGPMPPPRTTLQTAPEVDDD
jgi:YVTN family beta-propeller protein